MIGFLKKKKIYQRLTAVLISALLLSMFTWQRGETEVKAATKNLTNLVIFVNFSDTVHNHYDYYLGDGCFIDHPGINSLYNGTSSPFTLQNYLSKISYGALNVESVFPQLDSGTGKIVPLTLPNTTAYYADNFQHEVASLAQDVITELKKMDLSGYDLDRNADGVVDNLMIVVACENTSSSAQNNSNPSFWGVESNYWGSDRLAGKSVGTFTILTEAELYFSLGQSGTIAHEFLHTQGFPDLYRSRGTTNSKPVGRWDIMSSCSYCLQFPLAYTRMKVGGWISIPTVTSSQSSYSLYSPTATLSNSSLKDKQAVILKTPYSDSEFFVLEYRQKSSTSSTYEYPLEGSGLIIYRVNEGVEYKQNTTSDTYYIYIFRQGDSFNGSIEKAEGDMSKSYLSSESGRTSYGTADLTKGLSDGAITYSDGTNSGIVISNVGSAGGESISFKISFTDLSALDNWSTDATKSSSYPQVLSASIAGDGSIYSLVSEYVNYNYSYSLYKASGSSFTKVVAAPTSSIMYAKLAWLKDKLYLLYVDYDSKLNMKCLNGSTWTNVSLSISDQVDNFDAIVENGTLYLTYCTPAYSGYTSVKNKVCALSYNGSGWTSLGSAVGSNLSSASTPMICSNGSDVIVLYRENPNGSMYPFIRIKSYNKDSNSWSLLTSTDIYDAGSSMGIGGQMLYFVASSAANGNPSLYSCDLSKSSKSYTLLKAGLVSGEGFLDSSISVVDGVPYVLYSTNSTSVIKCYKYAAGSLQQVGNTITNNAGSHSELMLNNNKLQVVTATSSGTIALKSKTISRSTPTKTPTPVPTNTNTPKPTNTSTPKPTNTSTPTPTNTNTPKPTNTSTPKPTNTNTPRPTNTSTPKPTNTNTPKPTNTPTTAAQSSATPTPTELTKNTPKPTNTSTPKPTNTNTPKPTNTSTPKPTCTSTPRPTNTPRPTATNTPKPTNTNTPKPTYTNTPKPTNTNTPKPTNTSTPKPTNTPRPTMTSTPTLTNSPSLSPTPLPSATASPTNTPTTAAQSSATPTATPSEKPSSTPETTLAATPTDLPATESPTPTEIPPESPMPTESPTPTEMQTPTPTASPTEPPAETPTATANPTERPTATPTELPNYTEPPTPTSTPTPLPSKPQNDVPIVICLVVVIGLTIGIPLFIFKRKKK